MVKVRFLRTILAIVFITGITGASFYISRQLSSSRSVALNAPDSKPQAMMTDGGDSGGSGGGGSTTTTGNRDEDIEAIRAARRTRSNTLTPTALPRDQRDDTTPTMSVPPSIPTTGDYRSGSAKNTPTPTNSPTPTPTPIPAGRFGSKVDYLTDQNQQACGDTAGGIAGTYCSGGRRFVIDLPDTKRAYLDYVYGPVDPTTNLRTGDGVANTVEQTIANMSIDELLTSNGSSSNYNNCLTASCKQDILNTAIKDLLAKNIILGTDQRALQSEIATNKVAQIVTTDPAKAQELLGKDTVAGLQNFGLTAQEATKVVQKSIALSLYTDPSVTTDQLISKYCSAGAKPSTSTTICINDIRKSTDPRTEVLRLASIAPTDIDSLKKSLQDNKDFQAKIQKNTDLYLSSKTDSELSVAACANSKDKKTCQNDFTRDSLIADIPKDSDYYKNIQQQKIRQVNFEIYSTSGDINKTACKGDTTCTRWLGGYAKEAVLATLKDDPKLYLQAQINRNTLLENILVANNAKQAWIKTYGTSDGYKAPSYNGQPLTYSISALQEAIALNDKTSKALAVWIQDTKFTDSKGKPISPPLNPDGWAKEFGKIIKTNPNLITEYYDKYNKNPKYKVITDAGLYKIDPAKELNATIIVDIKDAIAKTTIVGLANKGDVFTWEKASVEYKNLARQKACKQDKSLAGICSLAFSDSTSADLEGTNKQYLAELDKKMSAIGSSYLQTIFNEKTGLNTPLSTSFSNIASVDNPLTQALFPNLITKSETNNAILQHNISGENAALTQAIDPKLAAKVTLTDKQKFDMANEYLNRRLVETTYNRGTGIGGAIASASLASMACSPLGIGAVACGAAAGLTATLANIFPILGDATQLEISQEQQKIKTLLGTDSDKVAGIVQSLYSNQGAAGYTADGLMLGGSVTRKDNSYAVYNSILLSNAEQGFGLQDINTSAFQNQNQLNIQVNNDFNALAATENNIAIANLISAPITGAAAAYVGSFVNQGAQEGLKAVFGSGQILKNFGSNILSIASVKFTNLPVAINLGNSIINLAQNEAQIQSTQKFVDTPEEKALLLCQIEGCTSEQISTLQGEVNRTNAAAAQEQRVMAFATDTFINVVQETAGFGIEALNFTKNTIDTNNTPTKTLTSAESRDSILYTQVEGLDAELARLGISEELLMSGPEFQKSIIAKDGSSDNIKLIAVIDPETNERVLISPEVAEIINDVQTKRNQLIDDIKVNKYTNEETIAALEETIPSIDRNISILIKEDIAARATKPTDTTNNTASTPPSTDPATNVTTTPQSVEPVTDKNPTATLTNTQKKSRVEMYAYELEKLKSSSLSNEEYLAAREKLVNKYKELGIDFKEPTNSPDLLTQARNDPMPEGYNAWSLALVKLKNIFLAPGKSDSIYNRLSALNEPQTNHTKPSRETIKKILELQADSTTKLTIDEIKAALSPSNEELTNIAQLIDGVEFNDAVDRLIELRNAQEAASNNLTPESRPAMAKALSQRKNDAIEGALLAISGSPTDTPPTTPSRNYKPKDGDTPPELKLSESVKTTKGDKEVVVKIERGGQTEYWGIDTFNNTNGKTYLGDEALARVNILEENLAAINFVSNREIKENGLVNSLILTKENTIAKRLGIPLENLHQLSNEDLALVMDSYHRLVDGNLELISIDISGKVTYKNKNTGESFTISAEWPDARLLNKIFASNEQALLAGKDVTQIYYDNLRNNKYNLAPILDDTINPISSSKQRNYSNEKYFDIATGRYTNTESANTRLVIDEFGNVSEDFFFENPTSLTNERAMFLNNSKNYTKEELITLINQRVLTLNEANQYLAKQTNASPIDLADTTNQTPPTNPTNPTEPNPTPNSNNATQNSIEPKQTIVRFNKEVFDPELEKHLILSTKDSIKTKEEKLTALENFKVALADQQLGLANIQTKLVETITLSPDISIENLKAHTHELTSELKLADWQKELIDKSLNEFDKQRQTINKLRKKYPSNPDLLKTIYGKEIQDPNDFIVTISPTAIIIEITNPKTYSDMNLSGFGSQRVVNIDIDGIKTNMGGVNTILNSNFQGVNIIELNLSKPESLVKIAKTHEIEHSINKVLEKSGVFNESNKYAYRSELLSNLHKEFLTLVFENKDTTKIIKSYTEYLEQWREITNKKFADEIIAQIKNDDRVNTDISIDGDGVNYEYLKNEFSKNDYLFYKHVRDVLISNFPEYKIVGITPETTSAITNLTNNILSDEVFQNRLKTSFDAYQNLIDHGLTKSEALNLLKTHPLSEWKNSADNALYRSPNSITPPTEGVRSTHISQTIQDINSIPDNAFTSSEIVARIINYIDENIANLTPLPGGNLQAQINPIKRIVNNVIDLAPNDTPTPDLLPTPDIVPDTNPAPKDTTTPPAEKTKTLNNADEAVIARLESLAKNKDPQEIKNVLETVNSLLSQLDKLNLTPEQKIEYRARLEKISSDLTAVLSTDTKASNVTPTNTPDKKNPVPAPSPTKPKSVLDGFREWIKEKIIIKDSVTVAPKKTDITNLKYLGIGIFSGLFGLAATGLSTLAFLASSNNVQANITPTPTNIPATITAAPTNTTIAPTISLSPTPVVTVSLTPTNTPTPEPHSLPTSFKISYDSMTNSLASQQEFANTAKYVGDIIMDCQKEGPNSSSFTGTGLTECMCNTMDCSDPNSGNYIVAHKIGQLSYITDDTTSLLQCLEFVNAIEYLKAGRKSITTGMRQTPLSISDCAGASANGLSGCTDGAILNNYQYCPKSKIINSSFQAGDIIDWKGSAALNGDETTYQNGPPGHTGICTSVKDNGSCDTYQANNPNDPNRGMVTNRNVSLNDAYHGVWRSNQSSCN